MHTLESIISMRPWVAGIVVAFALCGFLFPRSLKRKPLRSLANVVQRAPKKGLTYADLVYSHSDLRQEGPSVWTVIGRLPPYAVPLRVTMCIYRVPGTHQLWIHSPICVNDEIRCQIEKLGALTWIVVPNVAHATYAQAWRRQYPHAKVVCPADIKKYIEQAISVDTTVEEIWHGFDEEALRVRTKAADADTNFLNTNGYLECAGCMEMLPPSSYSRRQRKMEDSRRCKDCMNEFEHSQEWKGKNKRNEDDADDDSELASDINFGGPVLPRPVPESAQFSFKHLTVDDRVQKYAQLQTEYENELGPDERIWGEVGDAREPWENLPSWRQVRKNLPFDLRRTTTARHGVEDEPLATTAINCIRYLRPAGAYEDSQELVYLLRTERGDCGLVTSGIIYNVKDPGFLFKLLGSAGSLVSFIQQFVAIQDAAARKSWISEVLIPIVDQATVTTIVVSDGDPWHGGKDDMVARLSKYVGFTY